jgi:hypothetical protein
MKSAGIFNRVSRAGLSILVASFAIWAGADQDPEPTQPDPQAAKRENLKGVELYRSGDFERAIESFRSAAELDPVSPAIGYNLGTALARTERYADAVEALASTPTRATESLLRRDAFFNKGFSHAQDAVARAGSNMPPKAQLEMFVKAREAFREALIADASDAEAKHNYELADEWVKRLEELLDEEPPPATSGQEESDPENQDQQQQDSQSNQNQQNQENQQNQQEQQQGERKPENEGRQSPEKPDPNQPAQQDPNQRTDRPSNEDKPVDRREQEGGLERKPEGESGEPPQAPPPAQGGAEEEQRPIQLTQGQMDALRLLELLEGDRPEQFKELFQFKGKPKAGATKIDW